MKKNTTLFRTLLALALSLALLSGCVISVLAEGEVTPAEEDARAEEESLLGAGESNTVQDGQIYLFDNRLDTYPDDPPGYKNNPATRNLVAGDGGWILENDYQSTDSGAVWIDDHYPSPAYGITGTKFTAEENIAGAGTGDAVLEAVATHGSITDITVEKNVTATEPGGMAVYAETYQWGDTPQSSTVTIKAGVVNGDVSVKALNDKNTTTLSVGSNGANGDIHLEANGTNDTAAMTVEAGGVTGDADLKASGEGTEASLTVQEGGLTGSANLEVSGGGTASLTVEAGGVTANDDRAAVRINNGNANANANITGGIVSGSNALYSSTSTNGDYPAANTDITINGDVTAENLYGTAMYVSTSGKEATTTLNVTGDITAKGYDASAVDLYASKGGTNTATITGEIVATCTDGSYATGLNVQNSVSTETVTINGNVSATGAEESTGLNVYSRAEYHYSVKKDDISEDYTEYTFVPGEEVPFTQLGETVVDGEYYFLLYTGTGSEKQYYGVKPSELSPEDDDDDGDGYELELPQKIKVKLHPISTVTTEVDRAATTDVTITGDVTSDTYGATVSASPGAKTDIIIDGTVSGKSGGLVLKNNTELGDGVTLTVWAVDLVDNGAVFNLENNYGPEAGNGAAGDGEGSKPELTENKEAEAQLQYIIRVNAKQTDIIAAAGDAFDYRGYKVAHENDTVTLKLNIPDGYEVVEAYSDQAQSMKLEKNDKGEYFLTVPRGGAVELSVKLNKLPDPEPEPDTQDTVMITYVLDNGAQYDHVRMTAGVGEKISLQPAPEREGYTFLYWKGSDVDINSPYYKAPDPDNDFQFRPGASYTAKKDYNFVAVWKKN